MTPPQKKTPLPYRRYHAELCRSTSKGVGIIRGQSQNLESAEPLIMQGVADRVETRLSPYVLPCQISEIRL